MATDLLIKNLQNPELFPHPISNFSVIETHISWVILTGEYVYKIKKPLDLEFLNFTTLEKRKHFCEEELRLNKRLAPDVYLEVLPIYGSEQQPHLNANGEVIEYAIKMKEFPQQNRFDNLLNANKLNVELIAQVAFELANFHKNIPAIDASNYLGTPEQVHEPVVQNFDQLKEFLPTSKQLELLRVWSNQEFERIKNYLSERKTKGFIRECHGDVYLNNITLIDDKPVIFDCIEFNEPFRWTDTMADVGFMLMDLYDKKRDDLAHVFLNAYLQASDDYDGLFVLPYYIAYRAMVRAKIAQIRLSQPNLSAADTSEINEQYESCISVAEQYEHRQPATLYITHGLSGSGKSTIAHELMKNLGAIHLRSDVERKKLHDLTPQAQTDSPLYQGLYTPELTQQTYTHLLTLSKTILTAGYSIIVDATFLQENERTMFAELAKQENTKFCILHCYADNKTLEQRVKAKQKNLGDPSEARLDILAAQIQAQQALTPSENNFKISINTDEITDAKTLLDTLQV